MSILKRYIQQTPVQKDIQKARKQVHTDGYSMSIGELVNLYDDGEMDIRPEFQRLFKNSNFRIAGRFIATWDLKATLL